MSRQAEQNALGVSRAQAELGTLEAAREYVARGWAVVPIARGEKVPHEKEWKRLRLTEADLPATNQKVGGSNPSGRATLFLAVPPLRLNLRNLTPWPNWPRKGPKWTAIPGTSPGSLASTFWLVSGGQP